MKFSKVVFLFFLTFLLMLLMFISLIEDAKVKLHNSFRSKL